MSIEITPLIRLAKDDPGHPTAIAIRRVTFDNKGIARSKHFLSFASGRWIPVKEGEALPAEVRLDDAMRELQKKATAERREKASKAIIVPDKRIIRGL